MSSSRNDAFKNQLECVLTLIQKLKCKKKIELCSAWISRLQNAHSDEYDLRNAYLNLLYRQLLSGQLGDPFLTCPDCYGKLPSLECQYSESGETSSNSRSCCKTGCKASKCSPFSCGSFKAKSEPELNCKTPRDKPECPEIRVTGNSSNSSIGSNFFRGVTPEGIPGSTLRIQTENGPCPSQADPDSEMRNFYDLMGGSGNVKKSSPHFQNPEMPDVRRRLNMEDSKFCSPENSQYLMLNEDNSYSETPEPTARSGPRVPSFRPGCIDSAFKRRLAEINVIYELRVNNLNNKVNSVNTQNNAIRCQFGQLKEMSEATIKTDQNTIRQLHESNRQLQCKLQKSNGDHAAEQCIEQISQKLNETVCVNNELQDSINMMNFKLDESERCKNQDFCQIRQSHKQEIEDLNDCNRQKLMTVINDYNTKLQDMEKSYKEQIRCLAQQHDNNIQQLITDNDLTFQEFKDSTNQLLGNKNSEIERLKGLLEKQCETLKSQVEDIQCKTKEECKNPECVATREKLCQCQKWLHKMKNVKDKCLKHCDGKLLDVLKEKHRHENMVRMMLMKQNAEITLQVFTESQLELKDAVCRFQDRYKRIIESMQHQITNNKVEVDDIMSIQLKRKGSEKRKSSKNTPDCCEDSNT